MSQITSSNFIDNNSTNYGGAIYFQEVNYSLDLNHLSNNFAYKDGGALYLLNSKKKTKFDLYNKLSFYL